MLGVKMSAGVAPEVNLRNLLHADNKAMHAIDPPSFETKDRHHQKSKTGVSIAIQKYLCPPKFFLKKTDIFVS